jgi:hypothetical protein
VGDPIDPDALTSAELEAALVAAGGSTGEDAWRAWMAAEGFGVFPGRFAGIPTDHAYVLFRAWCDEQGRPPLAPFTFARAMLTRFRKRAARGPWGVRLCYCVSRATAERLRAASEARPPTPADSELFSFAELRRAFNPALRQGPDAAPQEDPSH